MTKITKLYEINSDPMSDEHILVPVGYAGLNEKELQEMEDNVRKIDKSNIKEIEHVRRLKIEHEAKLKALEKENPPYKKQWEKLHGRKLGEVKEGASKEVKEEGEKQLKKKKGCSSCAKKGLLGLIKGGAKLLKSELGVDAADEETMAKRKEMCLGCPIYDFGVCVEEKGGCGCFVAAKIKLKGEACPLSKWEAVS